MGAGPAQHEWVFFRQPPSVFVCAGVYFYFVYVLKRGGAFSAVTQRLRSLNALLKSLSEVRELRCNYVLFEHKHVQWV